MADELIVRVNIGDFKRQLQELGRRAEKSIVSSGTRAAANVIRDTARQLAPVLRSGDKRRVAGALRRAVQTKRRRGKPGTVEYSVVVRAGKTVRGRSEDAFYWRFLEGGWSPRGPGQGIRGGTRRKALERRRAAAAGARTFKYPFIAPAGQRSLGPAVAAFNERVTTGIQKAAKEIK